MNEAVPVPKSDPKARIQAAARSQFERFGFRRSAVAAIAREAGVAAGSIYLHFDSKEALLRDAVSARQAEWLAEMHRTLAQPGPALERLSRLGQASVLFSQRSVLLQAVLDRDAEMIAPALLDELHDAVVDQQVALIAEVIEEGIAAGTFRPVEPEKTAFVLVLAARSLFRQTRYGYEEILPLFTELASGGLLARGTERS
jgi:AcrR family transcriptional regulator